MANNTEVDRTTTVRLKTPLSHRSLDSLRAANATPQITMKTNRAAMLNRKRRMIERSLERRRLTVDSGPRKSVRCCSRLASHAGIPSLSRDVALGDQFDAPCQP